jgi:GntR family transcriptional regulator / MocR family aminotransferase
VSPEVAKLPGGTITRKARHATPSPSRRGRILAANAACREPADVRPFNAGIADTSLFSWDQWRVARYLAQFRGIRCAQSEVVISKQRSEAVNALCRLQLNHGDTAWVEDPCYLGVRAALGKRRRGVVVP